jgi:ATP-binding cassette subfamily B protein
MVGQKSGLRRRDRDGTVLGGDASNISAGQKPLLTIGRVVEQGGHQELLDRRGFYHDLYNVQFAESLAP